MDQQYLYPFSEQPDYLATPHEEGGFAVLKEFENKPEWLIKEMEAVFDEIHERWIQQFFREDGLSPEGPEIPPMTFERFRNEVSRHKKILDSTTTDINNFVPKNYLYYGTNDYGNERGFIVIQRVVGEDLINVAHVSPEMNQSFEQFLLAAFDFYEEQKNMGIGYFPDIVSLPEEDSAKPHFIHNIMFGKINDGPENIYLVDTYPLMRIWDDEDKFFDNLKRALEDYYRKAGVKPNPEVKERLKKYGNTIMESA